MKRVKTGLFALVVIALVAAMFTVIRADVATPRAQWTTVRMESEEVNISLGQKRVAVTAVFHMRNTGKAATEKVGYPLGVMEKALNDFKAFVNGEEVKNVRTDKGGDSRAEKSDVAIRAPEAPKGMKAQGEPYRFEGPYKQWQVFDVPMAENETKEIKITYWVEPAAVKTAEKADVLHYVYTLLTGATWKGKINEAVIRIKLDGVKPESVIQATPAGYQKNADGWVWTLKNFKPTENIEVTFKPEA